MTVTPIDPTQPPVFGLDHSAYRCRDAEETRVFYEDVVGFPLALALHIDRHPTTGEKFRGMVPENYTDGQRLTIQIPDDDGDDAITRSYRCCEKTEMERVIEQYMGVEWEEEASQILGKGVCADIKVSK